MYELPVIMFIKEREDAEWVANELQNTYPNGVFAAEQTVDAKQWLVCGENEYDCLSLNYLKGYAKCLYEYIDNLT